MITITHDHERKEMKIHESEYVLRQAIAMECTYQEFNFCKTVNFQALHQQLHCN